MVSGGLIDDNVCQRCAETPQDELHRIWQCPANQEINEECVKETEELVKLAIEGRQKKEVFTDAGIDPEKLDADSTSDGRPTYGAERYGGCVDEVQGLPRGRIWRTDILPTLNSDAVAGRILRCTKARTALQDTWSACSQAPSRRCGAQSLWRRYPWSKESKARDACIDVVICTDCAYVWDWCERF